MRESDRKAMMERFIPIAEGLMRSPEGMRDLAAICAFYMQEHKPETTVPTDGETGNAPPDRAPESPPPERSARRGRSRDNRGNNRRGSRRPR